MKKIIVNLTSIKKILKRAYDSYSQNSDEVFDSAMEAGFVGDYEESIELFERVNYLIIGHSDKKMLSWFYRAIALGKVGKIEEAIEEWKKYLAWDKKDSSAWNNLGEEYTVLEKYDEALDCYDKAITLEPDVELFWTNKVDVYLHLENDEEYEKCVNKALEINPESTLALSLKTGVFWNHNQNNEAVRNEEKIVELEPDDWTNWNALGTAYHTAGNNVKALDCFERAIKLDSTEDLLWYNKACVLSEDNREEEALDSLLVAISLNPEILIDMRGDNDFKNIKNTERFKKFLSLPV